MTRILLSIALCTTLSAAGVTSSVYRAGVIRIWVVQFQWVAASNGSVTATAASVGGCCQGFNLIGAEIVAGSVAPTAGYSVTLTDQSRADLLANAAAALSATDGAYFVSAVPPTLYGTVTLNVSGNSVSGATGWVYVFLQSPQ